MGRSVVTALGLSSEEELWQKGYQNIAGVDEAGRGPLAGPVFAAACILYPKFSLPPLNDSKKLSERVRESLFEALTHDPQISYAIASVDVETIDEINILQATLLAMKRAVEALPAAPDYLLVDGNLLPNIPLPARAVVQGDGLVSSIAAASILAKVSRDRLMKGEVDKRWPEYGFLQHKGYGTQRHREAIRLYGLSPIHRKSFCRPFLHSP